MAEKQGNKEENHGRRGMPWEGEVVELCCRFVGRRVGSRTEDHSICPVPLNPQNGSST